MHPLAGIAGVISVLITAVLALRFYQKAYSPHPELVRKLLHIFMGIVALGFPWIFREIWPVFVLAAVSVAGLIFQRFPGAVNRSVGQVLLGVGRNSLGDVVFPVSIFILFFLAHHTPLLYCIPILILTLADAVSALVGVRYGFTLYTTGEGHKSVEGSLAFFLAAFLSIHVPILLFSETGRLQSLLIGINLGFLVMLLEATAWMGLDNFFIPLGGFMLLKSFLSLDTNDLTLRLCLILAIFAVTVFMRSNTTLNDSAMLGAALSLYVFWSVGGWAWLAAPLILMLIHTVIWPVPEKDRGQHTVAGVISVTVAGFLWLFLWSVNNKSAFLYAFNISFAVHLALIGVAWLYHRYPEINQVLLLFISAFNGWLFIILPSLIFVKNGMNIWYNVIALTVTGLAALLYWLTHPRKTGFEMNTYHWTRQGLISLFASFLSIIPFFRGA